MPSRLWFLCLLFFFGVLLSLSAPPAYAQDATKDCTLESFTPERLTVQNNTDFDIDVKTKGPCFERNKEYLIVFYEPSGSLTIPNGYNDQSFPVADDVLFGLDNSVVSELKFPMKYSIPSDAIGSGTWDAKVCEVISNELNVRKWKAENGDCQKVILTTQIEVGQADDQPILSYKDQKACTIKRGEDVTLTASNTEAGKSYDIFTDNDLGDDRPIKTVTADGDTLDFTINILDGVDQGLKSSATQTKVCIDIVDGSDGDPTSTKATNCIVLHITDSSGSFDSACNSSSDPASTPIPPKPPCTNPKLNEDGKFIGCDVIKTGLGVDFQTEPTEFLKSLFTFLLSVSGGILLLLVIRSAYQIMTSQGNPEKIQEARERILSAIVGFVFLVFSLVILEIIGVDILHIPGFCRDGDTQCQSQTVTNPQEKTKNRIRNTP